MKNILRLLVVVLAVLVAGCASSKMRHLSGAEFVKQAGEIEELNSGHWTSYIGCSPGRAYLEFGYPAVLGEGARTTVYWTELAELPEDVAAKLKAGSPPWVPWRPSTNSAERPRIPRGTPNPIGH